MIDRPGRFRAVHVAGDVVEALDGDREEVDRMMRTGARRAHPLGGYIETVDGMPPDAVLAVTLTGRLTDTVDLVLFYEHPSFEVVYPWTTAPEVTPTLFLRREPAQSNGD